MILNRARGAGGSLRSHWSEDLRKSGPPVRGGETGGCGGPVAPCHHMNGARMHETWRVWGDREVHCNRTSASAWSVLEMHCRDLSKEAPPLT